MSDVDFGAITQVQQKTWAEGDFAMVAGLIVIVAEELAESLEIVPGERVLDVACGSGNGALAAARRAWGDTVGADFVPALLERGRELFGDGISDLRVERKATRQTFRSVDHWMDFFRTYFGPTKVAFERVGPEGEEALAEDLRAYLEESNTAGDRALVLEPEYLEVVATRA